MNCLLIARLVGTGLVWLLLTNAAHAQSTVYRCGPEGREYSSTPCPGGKAVQVDDTRSAEQQRQASDAAGRDAALADRMAAERRQRDASTPRGAAVRIGPARAASAPAKKASQPGGHKKGKKHPKIADPALSDPVRVPKPTR